MKKTARFLAFLLLIFFLALLLLLEWQFRKTVTIEGVIRGCWYNDALVSCSYIASDRGNFLLTEGSLDRIRAGSPLEFFYDKRVHISGRISRQTLDVKNMGKMHRFQIDKLDFVSSLDVVE